MSEKANVGKVMTADGPVDPADLGPTLTHEHILVDLTSHAREPQDETERELAGQSLRIELLGRARHDPLLIKDSLLIDDPGLAAVELGRFTAVGGGTVVDVSTVGLRAPSPTVVREVCRAAGLRLVACSGYYVQATHPIAVAEASVDQLTEQFVAEACVGIGDTGIRSGILGEIGMSQPGHPEEWKVLDAACRAQTITGLPLCVHPYAGEASRMAPQVARFVIERGVDPRRLNLCHMDGHMDVAYQRRILDLGAWISFDTFGLEIFFNTPDHNHTATDLARMDALIRLLDLGYADQLLLSHDVCSKLQLRRYGGYGYAHLVETIIPTLEQRGVTPELTRQLMVDNPARYLAIA
ncbi:MAG: phosphotriesterase-related protein [Actinobacteria bacterium]|nr:phosphotriesterase-related protein [Actinomycetota bacterium]